MNQRASKRIRGLAVHLILIVTGLIVLMPVFWTVGAGFRTQISLLMGDVTFRPILSNFEDVLWSKTSDFIQNFGNSVYVGAFSTFLSSYRILK